MNDSKPVFTGAKVTWKELRESFATPRRYAVVMWFVVAMVTLGFMDLILDFDPGRLPFPGAGLLTVAAFFLPMAFILFIVRGRWRTAYGAFEIVVGLILAWRFADGNYEQLVRLGAAYAILVGLVRGMDNTFGGIAERRAQAKPAAP